jgi:methylglutaconyl-CoA hydratase
MVENGSVESTALDGVATISFFHPQSNSLPGIVLHQLADAITEAGNNPEIKVIILKSEGDKIFCAGASFDELIAIDTLEKGKEFFSGFALVINAMRKAPKFIIARVQGKAVGGGVGLICASDYALATDEAAVKLSELAIGIGPFVVGPAVERKIGLAAFTDLAINATQWKQACWTKEKGMYNESFDSIAVLDRAVNRLAIQLSEYNPEAMELLKKAFWKGTDHWDTLLFERAEMSGKLILSDFSKNAINKFKASIQK